MLKLFQHVILDFVLKPLPATYAPGECCAPNSTFMWEIVGSDSDSSDGLRFYLTARGSNLHKETLVSVEVLQ